MSADEIINGIKKLNTRQRSRVLKELLMLRKKSSGKTSSVSLTQLAGKGAKLWKDCEVDEYLKKLRSEWD
ncbi:MAG: hypothetical protein KF846_07365 [Cyclobacteriaceae bacterium]|nr:hypothetical protein [Cyclobacteriaceae bacterium]